MYYLQAKMKTDALLTSVNKSTMMVRMALRKDHGDPAENSVIKKGLEKAPDVMTACQSWLEEIGTQTEGEWQKADLAAIKKRCIGDSKVINEFMAIIKGVGGK